MPWNIDLPEAEWYTANNPDLSALVEVIAEDVPILAIDTETTGLDTTSDVPLFWSLSWGERRICMPAETLHVFKPVLSDPRKKWILANAKFDQHILANVGLPLAGDLIDVQVMHSLLYEEQPHGLKYLASSLLGWEWADFTDTFRIGKVGKLTELSSPTDVKKGGSFQTVQDAIMWAYYNDLPRLVEYASNDAYGTWKCYVELKKQLEGANIHSLYPETYETLADYFFKLEVPFTRVLWSCERNGAYIDTSYLSHIAESVTTEMNRVERDIVKDVGHPINLNSPKELQKYLYQELKLVPPKLTKGGKSGKRAPSVDAEALEELSYDNPIAHAIVGWRELDKLLGTYATGLTKHIGRDGRIHTKLNQSSARTGRLSSSEPNLQNIPNAENDKFKIRRAFIPGPGMTMIVADYDTLEMRLLACASMEQSMIDMIRAGKDIHMGNAELVFGKIDGFDYAEIAAAKKTDKRVKNGELPESALTERMHFLLRRRKEIKATGFGLNYGMKEKKLARDLGTTVEAATELMEAYLQRYPAVGAFFDEAVADARATGYSFTVLGRRRYLPDIIANDDTFRWRAERQATNSPIQGCLPASTRILTTDGYVPIGEAPKQGIVWTGLKWAPYNLLDRGTCELATIELSNGQTLHCDTRHEVLVLAAGEYKFRKWVDLKRGDDVCLSIAKPLEFGSAKANTDSFYQLGLSMGKSLGTWEEDTVFERFINEVWGATLEERRALARGLLRDYTVRKSPTLHLTQVEVLQEFQVLLRTLGVESILRNLTDGSYELSLHKGQASKHLNWGRPDTLQFPTMRTSRAVMECVATCPTESSYHKAIQARVHKKWDIDPYTALEILDATATEHPPIYATRQVLSTQALGVTETTYTLSVQDPLHRFDSEGVISKNSASDVVKLAMLRCFYEADLEKRYGCKMLLQVHDELMFECPPESVEEVKPIIQEMMEHSLPTDLAVPLTISMGVGKSWAETH